MELFKDTRKKRSLLDPRTKLVVLLMIAIFVLGGAGSSEASFAVFIFSVLPFLLLLLEGRFRTFISGLVILCLGYLSEKYLVNSTTGILNSLSNNAATYGEVPE